MVAFIFAIVLLVVGVIAGAILVGYKEIEKDETWVTSDGMRFDVRPPYGIEATRETVTTENRPYKKFAPIPFAAGGLLFVILLIVSVTATVKTGHTGVQTVFGQVQEGVLDSGIHAKAPWVKVVQMDNRVQKATVDLSCFSSDIQEVECKYTLNYQIDKQNAQEIYKTIGKEYYDNVIIPNISESVKTITAQYTAENLIGNREELAGKIEDLLSKSLAKYNIKVVSTAIEDMDFTDEFTNAVEAKQVAVQNKLKAQTEQEQKTMEATQQAERNKIEAAANAEIAKIQAEADKSVAEIGADSAAYQGKKQSAILMRTLAGINGWTSIETEDESGNTIFRFLNSDGELVSSEDVKIGANNLVKYNYIQQWDGILPKTYVSGDDISSIIMGGE